MNKNSTDPRLKRRQWQNGQIHPNKDWRAWLFAGLVWLIAAIGFDISALGSDHSSGQDLFIMLLFTVAGAAMFYFGIRNYWINRQLRSLRLTLEPYPGRIGGLLGGHLLIPDKTQAQLRDLKVSAICIKKNYGEINSDDLIWQQQMRHRIAAAANGTRVSFATTVAPGLPDADPDIDLWWLINLHSRFAAVDYDFNIPVFATRAEPEPPPPVTHLGIDPTPSRLDPSQFPDDVVQIKHHGNDLELFYPSGPRQSAYFIMAFGLLFLIAGGWLAVRGGALIGGPLFMLMGGAIILAGLYKRTVELRVLITPERIHVSRRIGQWGHGENSATTALTELTAFISRIGEWDRSDESIAITALTAVIKSEPTQRGNTTHGYTLKAVSPEKSLVIGMDIQGQPFADGLLHRICEQINLGRPASPLKPETVPGTYSGEHKPSRRTRIAASIVLFISIGLFIAFFVMNALTLLAG